MSGRPPRNVPSLSPSQAPPPDEFDGYALGRLLGSGGMGHVYLAHDTVLDRPVAIKIIASGSGDTTPRKRFAIEARAIARLQHPNVVSIYRVGEVGGRPYLVSEFIRGTSLDRMTTVLTQDRIFEVALGVARALATAHRRGVLHRDIKPANVMLGDDGEVKLLDFGIAKLSESPDLLPTGHGLPGDPRMTAAGTVIGTPHYLAPELFEGEAATPRSDVYSLGALLYELCCGEPPNTESDYSTLALAAISRPALPLLDRDPTVDPRFAAIVDRCLRLDPAQRFDSGEEVRMALALLLPDERGPTLRGGNPYRGLQAFEAEHRSTYFGRDAEARTVLERLQQETLVVIAGDSGVGKSSLCRAGVMPRVAQTFGGRRRWSTLAVVPGRHPVASLALALAGHLNLNEASLAEGMAKEPPAVAREVRRRIGVSEGLVVFVDQLEELVTVADPGEAAAAAETLGWLTVENPALRVLASARGDFLSRLASLPGLGEEIPRSLYFLRPLSTERLREAVVGPARVLGVEFESESMVKELVDSTVGAEGGLPLLQFALARLWEQRNLELGTIPSAALEAMGGVAGALTRHADDVLDQLSPEQRAAARRVLLDLISGDGTRIRRPAGHFAGATGAAQALEALVRGRLLVARDAAGTSEYEVAHEALLNGWSTLRQWLREDADTRLLRDRLARAVTEWERLEHSPDALWSARQLLETNVLAETSLNLGELAFVRASHEARQRYKRKRLAAAVAVPVVLAALVGVAAEGHRQEIRQHLGTARQALAEARARDTEAVERQRSAFAAFDTKDAVLAEATWSEALTLAASTRPLLTKASAHAELAFTLDPANPSVQAALGEILFARAIAAERDRHAEALDEHLARLALHDPDGSWRTRWNAPARLQLQVVPDGTEVQLASVVQEASGVRAERDARVAGTTPLAPLALAPGSYVFTLRAAGRTEVRYPVTVGRAEQLGVTIDLPPANSLPPGYAYVAPGRFEFGTTGDEAQRRFFRTVPLHVRQTAGFIVAKHETTFGEWIDFLRALPAARRKARLPSLGGGLRGALGLTEGDDGNFTLSLQVGDETHAARSGEMMVLAGRPNRAAQDWRRFPVVGISVGDAEAYAGWLAEEGKVPGARLCTELEWERAARGSDDRTYPHGSLLRDDDANIDRTYGKRALAMGPDEVGSHPVSSSPFGVQDMSGNVWEFTLSSVEPTGYAVRSGGYSFGDTTARIDNREVLESTLRDATVGMRVCATWPPIGRRAEAAR